MNGVLKILFYIKKGKNNQNRNGNHRVNCRITYLDPKPVTFATNIEVPAILWNAAQGRAAGRTNEAITVNSRLADLDKKIKDAFWELYNRGEDPSAYQIRNIVTGVRQIEETILKRLDCMVSIKKEEYHNKEICKCTYDRYKLIRHRLEEFLISERGISDISIRKVDKELVKEFQNYVKANYNVSNNTFGKYFEPIAAVIKEAFESGIITRNALSNYKIKKKIPQRKFLNDVELKLIMNRQFDIPRLEHVRDVFIFQCFTGLAYAEIKALNKEKIENYLNGAKWIFTNRQKTDNSSNVPILNIPILILKKYEGKLSDGKLLPVISNQKMNGYLKEIADLCGVRKELSTHCARHTFATSVTLARNVSYEALKKMLGHKDIKTTQIYGEVLDMRVQREMEQLKPCLKDFEEALVL